MRHRAALVPLALAVLTAVLALPSTASAALPGFQVRLDAPALFKAGADAQSLAAVVSTDTARRCQKVRWSMLLKVADGVTFDDVKVTRIENGREFPLQSRIEGDTARLTDVSPDPGVLCRGQTVTARYDISFAADAAQGAVAYQVQALNGANQVLEQAAAQSRVLGTVAASPSASPSRSAEPSASPSASADDEQPADEPSESDEAAAPAVAPTTIQADPASNSTGVPSLLGPGLIVGAVFVLLGIAILMRLRLRNRKPSAHAMPTGFYPAP